MDQTPHLKRRDDERLRQPRAKSSHGQRNGARFVLLGAEKCFVLFEGEELGGALGSILKYSGEISLVKRRQTLRTNDLSKCPDDRRFGFLRLESKFLFHNPSIITTAQFAFEGSGKCAAKSLTCT